MHDRYQASDRVSEEKPTKLHVGLFSTQHCMPHRHGNIHYSYKDNVLKFYKLGHSDTKTWFFSFLNGNTGPYTR